ncbi:amidase signature domain-containing protein [Fusarium flagelliforme]|uniref:amidase signature domain-containing protein n=1 Tax=Fusarium flagelliforme TaxID=2675880 RepID=UPI001E8EB243|nr:amidase signature domain-containing protein [Fusarium flagelliforme]KAH7173946.1 amidase signature domain-containing protein [Fusarium flagelliforme]
MFTESYSLTATEVIAKIREGELSVEQYAQSLLTRIQERDPIVKAWVYINPEQVLAEARRLDQVPREERGPLHGVAVAVKDVIYTKDMPTQYNSPLYQGDTPQVDAASIIILRKAGALILGKTTTTEFAATTQGPPTTNPHDSSRTPGGSSSGSGAVVGDFQAPIALGTQTGGSTIRPASFNGIYGFKPTWNSISREGQKVFSIINDTLGFYARSVEDLDLLADVFALEDDEPPNPNFRLQGARIAICKTMVWSQAGYGLVDAMIRAIELLREQGAIVDEIEFPDSLQDLPNWYNIIFNSDGRTAFLPEYRVDKTRIADQLVGHVENRMKITRAAQVKAFDDIAAARPVVDGMLAQYDAVLTPSVPDEAPEGIESTGSAAFCQIWTVLHVPVLNIPGFVGFNGMPIGLSLVAPRYHDRKLLAVIVRVAEVVEMCHAGRNILHDLVLVHRDFRLHSVEKGYGVFSVHETGNSAAVANDAAPVLGEIRVRVHEEDFANSCFVRDRLCDDGFVF